MNMSSPSSISPMPRVKVAILPSPEAEYFVDKTISLFITNGSPDHLLVESLVLRFQSDVDSSAIYVEQPWGLELTPDEQKEQKVTVTPTPDFLANTNCFDVMVKYRVFEKTVWGKLHEEITQRSTYLNIKRSTQQLGQVFISFKQPEDEQLASILGKFAARAGFLPYIALDDPRPGTSLWSRIEPEIKNSVGVFVVWSRHTRWGTGVQQEIKICSECGISYVLLIEDNEELPEAYDTTIEYKRFDRRYPHTPFSQVIAAKRKSMLTFGLRK